MTDGHSLYKSLFGKHLGAQFVLLQYKYRDSVFKGDGMLTVKKCIVLIHLPSLNCSSLNDAVYKAN